MNDYTEFRAAYPEGDVPEHLLPAYDEARTTHALDVLAAVEYLAYRWNDGVLAGDVGPRFSCAELTPMLTLLRTAGRDDVADMWEQGHAMGDDDPYDEHHAEYVTELGELPGTEIPIPKGHRVTMNREALDAEDWDNIYTIVPKEG